MNKYGWILTRMILLCLCFPLCIGTAWSKKQTFFFNEEETLVIKVNKEGPIRIVVKGDRLQDVMGLEESTPFEKDEAHGFLYLRSLDKQQTITIITEGGTFQDITLVPETKGVSTVVLKSKEYEEEKSPSKRLSSSSGHDASFGHQTFRRQAQSDLPNSAFQDSILFLIKQLYKGLGTTDEHDLISDRPTSYGLVGKPLRSLKSQGMKGEVYEIVNITDTTLNLVEKDFYWVGDYAVSIGKKQLEANEKTLLMVVSHD